MLATMPKAPPWMSDVVLLDKRCPLPLDAPFTATQAEVLGVSRHLLSRLCQLSLIRPLVRGTYVAAHVVDSLELRASALQLVVPEAAVVTDRTAAWLHGVDILPRSATHEAPPVQMFSRTGSRLRRPGVASGLRSLLDSDVTTVAGVVVTTPLRTALDLGRLLGRFDALAALDGFLRLCVSHDCLLLSVERFKGERGVVQLRMLVTLADGRAESPAESVLRLQWYDAGLPRPELQWWEYDDDGVALYRLDLALPDCRYGAEYNGEKFHTEEDRPRDEARREWMSTRRSWVIDVFTKEDIHPRSDPAPRLTAGVRLARSRMGLWVPQTRFTRS
jgi:hypothetical protein